MAYDERQLDIDLQRRIEEINEKKKVVDVGRQFEKDTKPDQLFTIQQMLYDIPETRRALDPIRLSPEERARLEAEASSLEETMVEAQRRLSDIKQRLNFDDILKKFT